MANYAALKNLILAQNYAEGTTDQQVYDDLTAKTLSAPIPAREYLKKAIDLGIWDKVMNNTAGIPTHSFKLFADKIDLFGAVDVADLVYIKKMDTLVAAGVITAEERQALDDLSKNRLAKIDTIKFGKPLELQDITRVRK